ncbi:MAG: hypothetical protein ACOYKD_02845 [Anaerolineaceae bacterium]|jgi:hypothetical protein
MKSILRLFLICSGIALLLALIVFVVGYLLKWDGVKNYATVMVIIGGCICAVGAMSVAGGTTTAIGSTTALNMAGGVTTIEQRSRRLLDDRDKSYGFAIYVLVTGVILIVISQLLTPISRLFS